MCVRHSKEEGKEEGMTRTATRVVFPEIKRTEWESVSLPDTLKPTEVLVKAVRTLVSASTEIAIYSGTHINSGVPGARYPRYPFYPGYAFAGTVEAIGAEVTGFEPGDRVAGSMHHQDLVVVDLGPPGSAGQDALERIPDGVSFEQACLAQAVDDLHARGAPVAAGVGRARGGVRPGLDRAVRAAVRRHQRRRDDHRRRSDRRPPGGRPPPRRELTWSIRLGSTWPPRSRRPPRAKASTSRSRRPATPR